MGRSNRFKTAIELHIFYDRDIKNIINQQIAAKGYFYVCSRGENKFAKRFIPVANNSTRPKNAPSEAPEKNEIE